MIDENANINDIDTIVMIVGIKDKTYQVLLKDEYYRVLLNLAQTYSEKGILKLLELNNIGFNLLDKDELDQNKG